jgi:hypothetical protein
MKRQFVTSLFLSIALASPTWAGPARLCATSNGDLVARARCKAGETAVSVASLRDLLKLSELETPSTVNLAACRSVTGSDQTFNGTAYASVYCETNEILLNYGWSTDPLSLSFTRSAEMFYRGKLPYGILIGVQTELEGPDTGYLATFTLNLTGTCCPQT